MTPDLESLRGFVAVVDGAGFAAAAQRLNISRSMVSRRVAQLESQLGVALLTRNARTMALTEAGERFHARCVCILSELEAACEDAAGDAQGSSGLLRVTAPHSWGEALLAPVLAPLLLRHPQLRVELLLDERRLDLVAEGIDLALRFGPLEESRLVARRLGRVAGWILASPAYLAVHGTPNTPNELQAHNLLGHSLVKDLWRFEAAPAHAAGIAVHAYNGPQVRANDFPTLLRLALEGLGLVALPPFIGRAEVAQGRLRQVLSGHALSGRTLYAVAPRLSARVRLLMEGLVARMALAPASWGDAGGVEKLL